MTLISDIMNMDKKESGKMQVENIPFSLTEIIFNQQYLHAAAVENKGLGFLVHIDDKAPDMLIGDSAHLNQVLSSIIDYTIKLSSAGDIKLEVRLTEKNTKDNSAIQFVKLSFAIHESGPALTNEQINKIFNDYNQVNTSPAGQTLFISREMIKLMGGKDLQIQNTPCSGIIFSFTLCFQRAENMEEIYSEPDYAFDMPLLGVRILLADADKKNLEIAASLLENAGAELRLAQNKEDTLNFIEKEKFDIVFLDTDTPLMNGFAAAQKIRELGEKTPNLKALPLIAMNSSSTDADKGNMLKANINGQITKPVKAKEIISLVRKICGI